MARNDTERITHASIQLDHKMMQYYKSENGEGFCFDLADSPTSSETNGSPMSVSAVSLHAGRFPAENGKGSSALESTSAPKTVSPTYSERVSSLSDSDDMSAEDRNDASGRDYSVDDGNSAAVQSLVDSVKNCWAHNTASAIGKDGDKKECQAVMEDLLNDRDQLVRILIARKFKMDDSTSLFFEQVRFRARCKPQNIKPSDLPNALPSGAWRLCGYTRSGVVLSNYKIKCWDPSAYGGSGNLDQAVKEYTNYVVYMIERQIAQMRQGVPQQFALLFDLQGFKPSLIFRKDVRLMIRKLIYVAQAQYPERLHKVYLVNAPMGFQSAWRLVQPLLDEKTAAKIGFCSNMKQLKEDIAPEVLSTAYGGTHAEYPAN